MAERLLFDILKEQDTILDNLSNVLDEENVLLKERKALELKELNERKSKYLIDLQTNDQSLKYHSQKEKLKTDFVKVRQLLNNKLISCKRKNEINGRLIELNLAANRRLAASLMQVRDRNTMTYTGKGYHNAIRDNHISFDA